MTNLDRRVLLGIAGIAGAAIATQATRAGSLNPPPGPVTPTGKTTDQIEPRIDLLNAPASANVTSDANNQYIINNPGSYYLSANLTLTKSIGINIVAANVSLDLCGFQVAGTGTNTFTGIAVTGNGAWIGNGSLSTLAYGVRDYTNLATGCTLSRLRATQCSTIGLAPPSSSIMESCVAENNAGDGIASAAYSVLNDCTACSNTGAGFVTAMGSTLARCTGSKNGNGGFKVSSDCTLTDCIALANGVSALPAYAGILVGSECVLTRCVSSQNHATYGFSINYTCILVDCVAANNFGSAADTFGGGMNVAGSCLISGCTVVANQSPVSASTAGAGIYCNAPGTRIENCAINDNAGSGIIISSGECVVKACEVNGNHFDGVLVQGNSNTLTENRCVTNLANGIHVKSGSHTIVERNHLLDNTVSGVQIDSTVCFVYGNLARSNPTNYSVVAGNRVGQIVVIATNASPISGNSGGSVVTTDPYCNIAF